MATNVINVCVNTVYSFFKALFPNITKANVRTDYCGTCFILRKFIRGASSVEDKKEKEEEFEIH